MVLTLAGVLLGGCATNYDDAPTTMVAVTAEGNLLVDGQAVELEFLPGAVEPGKIVLDAHPDVPLERIDQVLNTLYESGFRNVEFLPATDS